MKTTLLLCLFTLIGVVNCNAQSQTVTITTRDNNRERSFRYYAPQGLGANPALVFCFHGTGGSSSIAEQTSGFSTLANTYKFIVCYPQAEKIGDDIQWNAYIDGTRPGHGGIGVDDAPDDITFTEDMIDYFAKNFGINTKRVFASGISNGGFMCYHIAVVIPDKIIGIAPVAANMWGDDGYMQNYFSGNSFKPVRIMHAHGTADKVVEYPDKNNNPNDFIYPLASFSSATCKNTVYTTSPIIKGVDKLSFCAEPNEIVLIRQASLGHTWAFPGYDLSGDIIRFFGLTSGTSTDILDKEEKAEIAIVPHPANENAIVQIGKSGIRQLTLINQLGQAVVRQDIDPSETSVQINLMLLPSGVYELILWGEKQRVARTFVVQH